MLQFVDSMHLARLDLCVIRFSVSTSGWVDGPAALPLSFQFVTLHSESPTSPGLFSISSILSDASSASGMSDVVLPMALSGPGGVVRVGVVVRNALGCEAVVDSPGVANLTLTAPSLGSLATQFNVETGVEPSAAAVCWWLIAMLSFSALASRGQCTSGPRLIAAFFTKLDCWPAGTERSAGRHFYVAGQCKSSLRCSITAGVDGLGSDGAPSTCPL